jgi:serine/threonine protein kinase
MASPDAAALAKLAVSLRLVTSAQIAECQEDGRLPTDPKALLRALERKGYLTPFQSQKLLKGEQDGYFLGNYRLLYRISSGSFGRVFRADDPRTGTVVAIKVLRRRWTSDPSKVELFEREAKLGMGLQHPNIVSILSTAKDPASKQYYIVMEFVEGGTLRDFLGIRKKLEAAESMKLLEGATAGLAHAFSRGVTHRDMKPTNILISAQGAAKLVDFGLAGITHGAAPDASEEDGDDKVDRSVDYTGLERATNVKPGDIRSDIYFLGCVAYQMLTGRSPLVITKDRHVRQAKERFLNVPPMTRQDVDAPPPVFELVSRMMSLDPEQRYQHPAQLLDAVRAARKAAEEMTPSTSSGVLRSGKKAAAEETASTSSGVLQSGKKPDSGVRAAKSESSRPVICLVERHPQLQELLRDKLTATGYEVVLEAHPSGAAARLSEIPFSGLLLDAAGIGVAAVDEFEEMMTACRENSQDCAGILILSEKQAEWAERVTVADRAVVMVRPVTLKQLYQKLTELVPPPGAHSDGE